MMVNTLAVLVATSLASSCLAFGGVGPKVASTTFTSSSPVQGQQEAATPLHMTTTAVPPGSSINSEAKTGDGDEEAWTYNPPDEISEANPLRVIIAGGGVGGLALANALKDDPTVDVTIVEKTSAFKRFGGPIQLASNALRIIDHMCTDGVYEKVLSKFTFTGDKENGIKDGIRDEWYAKFDLSSPAEARDMPYTGVIERPELQQIFLDSLPEGTIRNGDGVESYVVHPSTRAVKVKMESGETMEGDVLIGADGIWSSVRATMRGEPARGDGSGVSYSGYTVFAGELNYDSFDNGKVGYKVYIGPNQYFVITDIGNGRYQWYAFLAREPGSAELEEKPDGSSAYLQNIFAGWSPDVHHILRATEENEIEQRDLYDRPPSMFKPWSEGPITLLGDAVHAMMPNLGQGGCQAIEDALVLKDELTDRSKVSHRSRGHIADALRRYQERRLIRSAAVQGLSRFASDIIIRGFDTPAKIVTEEGKPMRFENFNYAGVVTKMMQPILPIFFSIQFNFLYDGWKNEAALDLKAGLGILTIGSILLLLGAGSVGELGLGLGVGMEALLGSEGLEALFGANIADLL